MTVSWPRAIELRLQQTLAQWRHWQCSPALRCAPRIVQLLPGGISNFSVLVESGQQFVVRIDGVNPAIHGLNRQTEWHTLKAAHERGLAPCPRYFNPDLGSLVCDYITPQESGAGEETTAVAHLLRAIHQLPERHQRLDLLERIVRYERQLGHHGRELDRQLRDCGEQVALFLGAINEQPQQIVLCHNDLLRGNRIYHADSLWAIDWEYSAMASPWYDLAVVINGDTLSTTDTEALLLAYLERTPSADERTALYQYGCIYGYLELLWYLALATPVLDQDAIARKTSALVQRLDQGVA
jgi:thiamine kinase-like enzyme